MKKRGEKLGTIEVLLGCKSLSIGVHLGGKLLRDFHNLAIGPDDACG
jgi:hypothetical protein